MVGAETSNRIAGKLQKRVGFVLNPTLKAFAIA
jgi:hypothetical protein